MLCPCSYVAFYIRTENIEPWRRLAACKRDYSSRSSKIITISRSVVVHYLWGIYTIQTQKQENNQLIE